MMMKRSVVLLMLGALLAFVAIGCGDSGSDPQTDGDITDTDKTTEDVDKTEDPTDQPEVDTVEDVDNITDGDVEGTDNADTADTSVVGCKTDEQCKTVNANWSCHDVTYNCMEIQCDKDSDCAGLCAESANGQEAECVCSKDGDTADFLCYPQACVSAADCAAGFVCEGGGCYAQIPATDAASCVLRADTLVVKNGATVTFSATAYAASGAVVTAKAADFTFATTADTGILTLAANVGTAGATTGEATVTAKIGSLDCNNVVVKNYGAVDDGNQRVVPINIKTGEPIDGAIVVVEDSVGGRCEQTIAISSGKDGIATQFATCTGLGAGPFNVHVFHNSYQYVSVYGLDTTDVYIPVEPLVDTTKCGGVKGEVQFTSLPTYLQKRELKLAITSLQISGNLLDIDFMSLLGENIMRTIDLGSLFNDDVALPSGIELLISKKEAARGFRATGPDGAGIVWTWGGALGMADVMSIVTTRIPNLDDIKVETLPFGAIISDLLPFLNEFYHGIYPGVTVARGPKVADTEDINGNEDTTEMVCDFANDTYFVDVAQKLVLSSSNTMQTDITFPTFAVASGSGMGAIVIVAADVTGVGLVPLGLTIALDEDVDGNFDGKLGNNGVVDVHYALQFAGVTGYKYVYLAAVLDVEKLIVGLAGETVTVTEIQGSAALKYQDTAPASFTFAAEDFPGFAGFTYDDATTKVTVTGAANVGNLVRLTFDRENDNNGPWAIYTPGAGSYTLPTLPAAVEDRIPAVDSDGSPKGAFLSGMELSVTMDALFGLNNTNLDALNGLTKGFTLVVPMD